MALGDSSIRSGVVGGTFLTTIVNISFHDVVFTAAMAVIGAVVSFLVSHLLRKVFRE